MKKSTTPTLYGPLTGGSSTAGNRIERAAPIRIHIMLRIPMHRASHVPDLTAGIRRSPWSKSNGIMGNVKVHRLVKPAVAIVSKHESSSTQRFVFVPVGTKVE